ncbi:hypothetical protein F558DRAFT_02413 [Streptomyces sp. AmelKG-A3]|nr:hypothetical protein F558DRAFT_02413 [Streptomyces sp. AmelKG-A3]
MTAVCTERGPPARVCYGQVESRFHEVFSSWAGGGVRRLRTRGSTGRCGFEPRHGRETAEKGEILHLLSVAPGL